MAVHSRDRDNKELGAMGGKKPISRQPSSFSRSSRVANMESLAKTLTEQIQKHGNRLMQHMDTIIDQAVATNSIVAGISRSQADAYTRLGRIERASPDLNPVELRTTPSDGNLVFHAVPTQVPTPLATRASITSNIDEVISPFARPYRAVEGPQLPRTDCLLTVPRKTRLTSDSVTISPVAWLREPGSKPKSSAVF